jgi:hypothetical protein
MSERDEFSAWAEDSDTGTGSLFDVAFKKGVKNPEPPQIAKIYVPREAALQNHLVDPSSCLPLDSDPLKSSGALDALLNDATTVIEAELAILEKAQKKIESWKEKIEKNKALQEKNLAKINENNVDMAYDRKNRDYWWRRAEQVSLDYQYAVAANLEADWSWLTKKYGLKNPDGSEIDPCNPAIEELSNGAASNLSGIYHSAGNRYENQKKLQEEENIRLIQENSQHYTENEKLRGYISNLYAGEIEPSQDGLLLMRELKVKLKALNQEGVTSTYGDLRIWSEAFLNDFLRSNPRIVGRIVTEFRKLTSIPLPVDHW